MMSFLTFSENLLNPAMRDIGVIGDVGDIRYIGDIEEIG
jgi:hypothetical protein